MRSPFEQAWHDFLESRIGGSQAPLYLELLRDAFDAGWTKGIRYAASQMEPEPTGPSE